MYILNESEVNNYTSTRIENVYDIYWDDLTSAQGEIEDCIAWRLVTYHNNQHSKSGLLTEFSISATGAHSKYTIISDAYDFQNALWAWHM